MQSNPLESARAKLSRAKYHLDQLKNQMEIHRKNQAYGFSFRHVSQTDELVIKAVMPHDIFTHYSILAGEVINQARSSLEHAMWEMVPNPRDRRVGGLPVTGFPVFWEQQKYNTYGQHMIDGINSAAKAIIDGLQPFRPDYEFDPLYVLNELWNRDKHRLLNTCIAYPQGMSLIYEFPDGHFNASKFVNVPENVDDGAELFRERHPGPGVKVIGEGAISSVRFTNIIPAADGKTVDEFLPELVGFTESIIEDLAKTI